MLLLHTLHFSSKVFYSTFYLLLSEQGEMYRRLAKVEKVTDSLCLIRVRPGYIPRVGSGA